ncbi:TatA/E family twin arginine-targeting protein translocase [Cyanobium sp. BA20m-p-22]|uniref:TatA/E family twin arginine-targeting protein translocase n=1 Tax=Cyanobium sp. BA20m-p-22 TaxID=2823704 RepID=UPI0020CFC18D|nr:TatA/E family twin arginine-targeting protein translocase [Cyanobium sp. BA20m-p-22]
MNIFGIGLPEMAVIAAIGLLVFGPKRLPELGKTLGRTLKGFQSASSEFEKEFKSAITTADITTADITTADITTSEITTANLPEARPGEIQAVGQVVESGALGLPQVVDGPPA